MCSGPSTTEGEGSIHSASYRDPSGFVFTRGDVLLRQVNKSFAHDFEALHTSGLYEELSNAGMLVPHQRVETSLALTPDAHAVIEPARIPFVSYPYEWSFAQLKDAALLTLDLQLHALGRGFTLRDASAYNVQFLGCRPVFIDTLSFGRHRDGLPWTAYRQFCEHFLVPLALMARCDVRCGALLRQYIDGVPLDLGSRLLPRHTWLNRRLLLHVHLHGRAQAKYADAKVATVTRHRSISTSALVTLLRDLRDATESLEWQPSGTEWADYATNTNYSDAAYRAKRDLVRRYLEQVAGWSNLGIETLWDLGANTGTYSQVASRIAKSVVAFDIDPAAVQRAYDAGRASGDTTLLPLVLDAANPSPSLGWAQRERMSLVERGPADTVMALALIHHLAISRNVPLGHIASYFAEIGRSFVIEFVAEADSQVQRLLRNRDATPHDYSREAFERAFTAHFRIVDRQHIPESHRWLYLMRRQ